MLTCECDFMDDDCDYYFEAPEDFEPLTTPKRQRCWSCQALIELGTPVLKFTRWRFPRNDIEARIWGDFGEIPLASHYHCEDCGGLYASLEDLGFCGQPWENQRAIVKEYAALQARANQAAWKALKVAHGQK